MALSSNSLYQFLADGSWHSGQELADSLSVSRTVIWKHIEKLRSRGMDIEASSGRGYRLVEKQPGLFSEALIVDKLSENARTMLDQLVIADSLNSTNDECMRLLGTENSRNSGKANFLVLAEQQTHGRGRRGKQWYSPYASNLYMSASQRFEMGAATLSGLSLVVGLAVVSALVQSGLKGVQLKWPNDIVCEGKKLGGILLEITGDLAGPCYAVIGIGLNLKMPSDAEQNIDQPYSDLLTLAPEVDWNKNELVAAIVDELYKRVALFKQQGFAPFREEWQKKDCYLGQNLVMSSSNSRLATGKHLGVNDEGAIMLETPEGVQSFSGGEITLRPSYL